jgi:hypothetical protein
MRPPRRRVAGMTRGSYATRAETSTPASSGSRRPTRWERVPTTIPTAHLPSLGFMIESALIGAFGAVLGGGLTAGSSVLVEARKRRAEERAAETHSDRELRLARRLVLSELAKCVGYLAGAVELGWPLRAEVTLPVQAWEAHGSALADHLDDENWLVVSGAYGRMALLEPFPAEPKDPEVIQTLESAKNAMSMLKMATLTRTQSGS